MQEKRHDREGLAMAVEEVRTRRADQEATAAAKRASATKELLTAGRKAEERYRTGNVRLALLREEKAELQKRLASMFEKVTCARSIGCPLDRMSVG
jgi:hypothetical protein